MTESKLIQTALLSGDSEEFDSLLDIGELLQKESVYDLKKIPGASTTNAVPAEKNESRNQVVDSPRSTAVDDHIASPQSQRGFLPDTLRAAISAPNRPQTLDEQDRINALCASPPLERRKKKMKKKPSIRRTKSDKSKTLRAEKEDSEEDKLGLSLHISERTESPGRLCKSEELRKTDSPKSEFGRRKSKSSHQRRTISSRREKVRSRRSNPSKDSSSKEESSKPSTRKSKESRSRSKKKALSLKSSDSNEVDKQVVDWERKSSKKVDEPIMQTAQRSLRPTRKSQNLDTTEVDKQFVEWKRTVSKKLGEPIMKSEEQSSRPQRKPKKSRSAGSHSTAAGKARRSRSRQARSLSTSRHNRPPRSSQSLSVSVEPTKEKKASIDRKGPSPRQLQRKRTQKAKQADPEKPKEKPQKSTESIDVSPKKPRSRRALLTSKSTSTSTRNLLRKINKMNDDRILQEKKLKSNVKKPEPIQEQPELQSPEKPDPLDTSTRSTLSTSHTTTNSQNDPEETINLDATNNSACSATKPKEEGPKIAEPEDQDENPEKPPRTKSAPLRFMLSKNNTKLSKTSSNSSLTSLSLADIKKDKDNGPQKRTMFQKLGHKSLNLTEKFGPKSFNKSLNLSEKFGPKSFNRSLNLTDQLQKFVKGSSKSKNGDDDTAYTGNRRKVTNERRRSLQRSRSDSTLGLPKKKKNSKSKSTSSQYDLMLSMHSTDEDYEYYDFDSSDDENSFSGEDVDDINDDLTATEASKLVSPPSPSLCDIEDEEEGRDQVVKLKKNKSLGEHVATQKMEECDDILSMAEFSDASQLTKGLNESSCLQIDFSKFSEHGTPAVKAKKVVKRGNRSKREGRTPILGPTVQAL